MLIIKPDNEACGRGIFITNDLRQVPSDEKFLIQEYLQKPHLIDNLKYDIRLYVLITSADPLKIYLFKEGIVRFATQEYTNSGHGNKFIHLTNYTLNKENK
jgi:hypothetical protein